MKFKDIQEAYRKGWRFRDYSETGSMSELPLLDREGLFNPFTQAFQNSGLGLVLPYCLEDDDERIVCLDNDITDSGLNDQLLSFYRFEGITNCVMRKPNKIGKLFVIYEGNRKNLDFKIGKIDIIHEAKRCNVFGTKDDGVYYSTRPGFKHVLELDPYDLPRVDDDFFDKLIEIVGDEEDSNRAVSRHDTLSKIIGQNILIRPIGNVMEAVMQTESFKDLDKNGRDGKKVDIHKEVADMLTHVMRKAMSDDEQREVFLSANKNHELFKIIEEDKNDESEDPFYDAFSEYILKSPEPEKGSLANILYELTKAHSPLRNIKGIAWIAVRSMLTAMSSTRFACDGINARSFAIIIAKSSAGKGVIDDLKNFLSSISAEFSSICTDFENRQAIVKSFEYENRLFVVRDESQDLFSKKSMEDGTTREMLKYVNNIHDDSFSAGIKLKNYSYGYAYAPILNGIFTTTESFLKNTDSQALSNGMIRRPDFYITEIASEFKVPGEEDRISFHNVPDELKAEIGLRLRNLFRVKSTKKIPLGVDIFVPNEKPNLPPVKVETAVHRISENIPIEDDAKELLKEVIIILNKITPVVQDTMGEVHFMMARSLREKVIQYALFFQLSCRRKPKKSIDKESIYYGIREFFRFQWPAINDIAIEKDEYIEGESIRNVADSAVVKIISKKLESFTNSYMKRTLPKKFKQHTQQVINNLIKRGRIEELDDSLGRKNYKKYRVLS